MSLPLFAFVVFFFAIGVIVSALFLYTQIAYFLTVRLPWIIRDYLKIPDRGQPVGYLTVNLQADTSQFMSDIEKAKKAAEELKQLQTKVINDAYAISTYGEEVTNMHSPAGKREFIGTGIASNQFVKKASRRAKARN